MMLDEAERTAFAKEYPGWEAWRSLKGGQWHARLIGAMPPMMVHDDNPEGLGEQVRALAGLRPPLVAQDATDGVTRSGTDAGP
jgi:hypothetical protein